MAKAKVIRIADNSGLRRRQSVMRIWRNDITGMEPGSCVAIRFVDEYTRNGAHAGRVRYYIVDGIAFDDDYAAQRGRHTVTLRKAEGGKADGGLS